MIDISRALSALHCLDAGCSREEWIQAGMAAKAANILFDDWHNWSKSGANYKNEKDCRSVWVSFKEDGGITEATLFNMAIKHGWQDPNKSNANRNTNHGNSKNKNVNKIWGRCLPALSSHEYIMRKRGQPEGLRYYPESAEPLEIQRTNVAGYLVVPCYQDGELQTLQFIPPNKGEKKLNLHGASFNDGFYTVGLITQCIYICEGIGQAWAVNKASDSAAVVCFGAGRMTRVTKILRDKYPENRLVVVPDRGKEKLAAEIAGKIQGKWIEIPADKPDNFDVNDYAQEYGHDLLAELLCHEKTPKMRYELLSANDLVNLPAMSWIVKGVLPRRGLAALYGPSMSGKSFLALSLIDAVTKGDEEWFGYRVYQVPATYVCLEGEAGVSKRVKALMTHIGKTLAENMKFVIQEFNLLNDNDITELAKAIIAANGFNGIVVIDTLNRSAPGIDENSSKDMSNILSACEKLRRIVGGLILLVHHTSKGENTGPRGHSSLFAGLDAGIETVRTENPREWKLKKAKDDESGGSHSFNLELIKLGKDEDDDDITSCVVVPCASTSSSMNAKRFPTAPNQKIIWNALGELFKKSKYLGLGGAPDTKACIKLDDAIEQTKSTLPCDKKRQKERASVAITGLVSNGLLRCSDGWLWVP